MALVLKKEQEELFVTQYLDLRELRTNMKNYNENKDSSWMGNVPKLACGWVY